MFTYYSMRLILSSVDSRPNRLSPLEQYDLAYKICRGLEWYILNGPENMINRLAVELHAITNPGEIFSHVAFPVRVAWEVFPGRPRTTVHPRGFRTGSEAASGEWNAGIIAL